MLKNIFNSGKTIIDYLNDHQSKLELYLPTVVLTVLHPGMFNIWLKKIAGRHFNCWVEFRCVSNSVKRSKAADKNDQIFRSKMLLALKPKWMPQLLFSTRTPPVQILSIIKPNIHVLKGVTITLQELPEYQTVVSNGGEVKCVSFVDGYSSSAMIQKIAKS